MYTNRHPKKLPLLQLLQEVAVADAATVAMIAEAIAAIMKGAADVVVATNSLPANHKKWKTIRNRYFSIFYILPSIDLFFNIPFLIFNQNR